MITSYLVVGTVITYLLVMFTTLNTDSTLEKETSNMAMRVYKLYSGSTTSANGAAELQFVRNATITGILFGCRTTGDGSTDVRVDLEVSAQNSAQNSTNGIQNVLAQVCMDQEGISQVGVAMSHMNQMVAPLNFTVRAGDKVYLNLVVVSGTVTAASYSVFIYTME